MNIKGVQSCKWNITINNPVEHGFTHDVIKENLKKLNPTYWCLGDEIGLQEHTYHTHVYLFRKGSAIRGETILNLFPKCHIEKARGSSAENRAYIKKDKPKYQSKAESTVEGTFEESGTVPVERQGERTDLIDLYAMVKEGYTDYQILEDSPEYMLSIEKVRKVRQIVNDEKFRSVFRKLQVTYISGRTGEGKTRYVMEKYGYDKVYRITNYQHPFDSYDGEDVILFDEFRSSLPITEMLVYLDGYPCKLPARFADRVACYTKVYIISNVDIKHQFIGVQENEPETYKAFLRRINEIMYIGSNEDYYEFMDLPEGQIDFPFNQISLQDYEKQIKAENERVLKNE